MFRKLGLKIYAAAHGSIWSVAALMALTVSANGSTLVFVPQLDTISGTTNYSWFNAGNWFMPDGSQAFRVPQANDGAVITLLVDAETTGVRVQNLVLTNNAVVSNGTFSVQNLQMLSASSFKDADVNILVSLNVGGTNCMLSGTSMDVLPIASGNFAPVAPATASTLTLAQGSAFEVFGAVTLAGGSQIIAGSLPQSILVIEPGGVLSSTNLTYIEGSASGHLVVDNSGLIRADGGTLRFDNGIDWRCSAGTGEFKAASTSSLILFASGFHADVGTTSLVTGSGTNRWPIGGTIDGTAQVGAVDPNTSAFSTGNLEILSSCSGLGSVHVLGDLGQTALLNWSNGTLSLAALNIDMYATMLISGGAGTSRQLSGCALNNSGICSVLSGDLALGQGASINNLAGGTFDLVADGTFSGSPSPLGGAVNNAGTFRKSSPGLTQFGTVSASQGPDFNNTGLLDLVSGQLNLLGGSSSGQFQTEAGGVLWFWGGTHTLSTGASFTGPGSVRLYQGASAPQWLVTGSISVAELELGSNGLLVGTTNAPGNPIGIGTLIVSANGSISNGTYAVQDAQMLDASTFIGLTMSVVSNVLVGGTNCMLRGSALTIASSALANFAPLSPPTASTLILAQGSILQDSGTVMLAGGSQIIAGSSPQSTLVVEPGGVLGSTNLTYIEGSTGGHLIVDNSGLIRVDGGTLRFDSGIDWRCTAGTGEFRAAATNSLILFASGFHTDVGTTSLLTGLGTNRWPTGGTIDGTAQVGTLNPNTLVFSTGNLEILSSCSGLGSIHVLGNPAQTAVLNWGNGTLSLAALNIDANATMLISGGVGTSRQLSGCALNNRGLCMLSSGDLGLSLGAAINNLAGGTFELLADGTFSGSSAPGGGSFNNAGTFRKSTSGTTQFGTAIPPQGPDFNNAGLVELLSGQLNLMGGNSSGQFQIAAGAALWFWGGTHTLGTGASFTGPGSVRLFQGVAAPQWLVNGSVSTTELELGTNGTVGGTGTLGIGSVLHWTNGVIQGSGSMNISPGATLDIGGSAGKTLSQRTINNQGSILLHDQATVTCGTGATLNILAGGTLDIQTDASLTFSNAGPMLLMNNAGRLVKSAGTQTSFIAADLNNSGTIEVKAGTLQFQGSWSQTAGSTTVDAGTVLGGTLLSIGGGTLAGSGTVQAAVLNGGVTSPGGSPGTLSLGPGENYQQAAGGILRIELGGYIPGTQCDQLVVGGSASLAGTLELSLINGFVPHPGDHFQILTCASQNGRFSQISPPALSGAVWVAHSNGTNVSVVLANPVNIAKPVLSGGMFKLSLSTTTGLTYVVQWSDTLSPSDWQTLVEIAGDGGTATVPDPATKPQRFYRVLIQ
jgi:uncharacterized protein YaiE (UPF0345 family)